MLSKIQKNDDLRLSILQGSIIMAIICGIVGFFIIYEMKKKYLREVYMLTFLNEAMIIKNKRIESYLDALLKNKWYQLLVSCIDFILNIYASYNRRNQL